jgi:hypothetical protein
VTHLIFRAFAQNMRRKCPPRDVTRNLLNIPCGGNPCVEIAGQTGFAPR